MDQTQFNQASDSDNPLCKVNISLKELESFHIYYSDYLRGFGWAGGIGSHSFALIFAKPRI